MKRASISPTTIIVIIFTIIAIITIISFVFSYKKLQDDIKSMIDFCTNNGMIYINDGENYIQCLDNNTNTMKYYAVGD